MNKKTQKTSKPGQNPANMSNILWTVAGVLSLLLMTCRIMYPEFLAMTILVALPLVAVFAALIFQNQKALRSRSASFGLNSAVTVLLVFGIVGVLNFLVSKYPKKLDFTTNKKYTLSDQTVKLVKGLKTPIKATVWTGQKDRFQPLMDNYKALNSQFEVEYVDPIKEMARSSAAGVKKPDSIFISIGAKEGKADEITEEKVTNALIKLLKEKSPVLCTITGHGEKNFSGIDGDGYDFVKKAVVAQYYDVKEITLLQEKKVPETCDAIAIVGPTKSYFEPEVKMVKDYLDDGGRAIFALDINLKGAEYNPGLISLIEEWYIRPISALIVDPYTQQMGRDASLALSLNKIGGFSRDSAITKEFYNDCIFPVSRPLESMTGAPAGLKVQWISQTTPQAFGILDLSQLKKGTTAFSPKDIKRGPLNLVVSAEGKQKDSKAKRNTRIVVVGTSNLATNQFARNGGNLDLFVNSISWVMEDESLISIRAKEDTAGKIEMSQKLGNFVYFFTIFALPMVIAACGVGVWVRRRKL